jgi:hypothetical protein
VPPPWPTGQAPWPPAFVRHKLPYPQPSGAPSSPPSTALDAPFFWPRSPPTNAAAGATVSSAAGVRGPATLRHPGPSYGCSGVRTGQGIAMARRSPPAPLCCRTAEPPLPLPCSATGGRRRCPLCFVTRIPTKQIAQFSSALDRGHA